MTYKYITFFKWITVLVDYFLLNFALFLVFLVESDGMSFWAEEAATFSLHVWLFNLFWFYCSSLVELYNNALLRSTTSTMKATITALLMYLVFPLALVTLLSGLTFTAEFFIQYFIVFSVLLLVWKTSFLAIRKSRSKFWIAYKKVIIVGPNALANDLQNYLIGNPQLGYKVERLFYENTILEADEEQGQINKSIEECIDFALENGVSEIFYAFSGKELEKVKVFMREADKHLIRFRLVPDLNTGMDKNILLEIYGNMPVLTLRKEPLNNKANEIIKRVFDICFSLCVILFLLSWLLPVLALMIKLESKGPVFFKQLRSGKSNRPFYCYKLRSMRVNVEADTTQASRSDKRITRLGAILRKTSLDELPQFFNVLMGEMSVVGPRPHMLKHTQDYAILINKFMVRHFLTPGITGWAQVKGFRGETKEPKAMENRVEADLWYLENWSLFLDIKIIILTIRQVWGGSENAF